jgi:hypothetical protein
MIVGGHRAVCVNVVRINHSKCKAPFPQAEQRVCVCVQEGGGVYQHNQIMNPS